MKTSPVSPEDLRRAFAAIAVVRDAAGRLDLPAMKHVVEREARTGATCFVVGAEAGARVQHADEMRTLCAFLSQLPKSLWGIPVLGDAPETWLTQAEVLRATFFPCVGLGLGAAVCGAPDRPEHTVRQLSRAAKKPIAVVIEVAREMELARAAASERLLREALCVLLVETAPESDLPAARPGPPAQVVRVRPCVSWAQDLGRGVAPHQGVTDGTPA